MRLSIAWIVLVACGMATVAFVNGHHADGQIRSVNAADDIWKGQAALYEDHRPTKEEIHSVSRRSDG